MFLGVCVLVCALVCVSVCVCVQEGNVPKSRSIAVRVGIICGIKLGKVTEATEAEKQSKAEPSRAESE